MEAGADTLLGSDLREQLLASVQRHGLPNHRPEHQLSNTANPHHHNIDPAIAGTSVMHANPDADDGTEIITDGRKGKRELSTSKRAAQNRAAQVCGFVDDRTVVMMRVATWTRGSRSRSSQSLGDKDNSLLTYYYCRERSDSEKKATSRA